MCMCDLLRKWLPKPFLQQRCKTWLHFAMTLQGLSKHRPSRKTSKSDPNVCHCQDWEKDNLQTLYCSLPTFMPRNLLCMLILQIPQSPSIQATTNNNPLPSQHPILLRQRTPWPQQPGIRVHRLCFLDLWKAKVRWKKRTLWCKWHWATLNSVPFEQQLL